MVFGAELDELAYLTLADFFLSGRPLNTARRAHSAASIQINSQSRFLFAIGGDDGAADGSVLPSYLLDPADSPQNHDLDFDLNGNSDGVAEALWHYRVAAVLSDGSEVPADPNNPGGRGWPRTWAPWGYGTRSRPLNTAREGASTVAIRRPAW